MAAVKSSEDPAVRSVKLLSELYFFMAEEFIRELGEEKGKAAIRLSLKHFAEKRVSDMKQEAAERGLPAEEPKTYFAVRDLSSEGWESDSRNPLCITECPMYDVWKEFGTEGQKMGALYCEIDHILFSGFGMQLNRPRCKTQGDAVCDFQVCMQRGNDGDGER